MESPAAVPRYINKNSKKRSFLGGGSSSSSALELDASPPPINFVSAKPRSSSSKEEEVLNHAMIDMEDMEEDVEALADEVPKTSTKGKEPLQDPPVNNGGLSNDEFMDDTAVYDFSSSLFDGEDEWAEDSFQDEMLFDDFSSAWESQFDHMDIPTGVEVQFPWFAGTSVNDTKVPETSSSSVEPQPKAGNSSTVLSSSELLHKNRLNTLSSSSTGDNIAYGGTSAITAAHKKFNAWAYAASPYLRDSKAMWGSKSARQSSYGKRNHRSMNFSFASQLNHSPSAAFPTTALGWGSSMPLWKELSNTTLSSTEVFSSNGASAFQALADHVNKQKSASSVETMVCPPTISEPRNIEDVVANYFSFKRFETVEDFSDHHYCSNGYPAEQPPKNWARKIQEEWRILENDLPNTIYVRAYEARMDLLRAVIIGAEGTPYHDGLFFFDICFPKTYPNVPPLVYYHSGGLRINPNLYNCGKVCLSLLNTWSGSLKEKWIPGESTMLQVLVSIQGLILNAEPFFNEPGYANMKGSTCGEERSLKYNESTFVYSLQTMVYKIRNPPKYFEDFVLGHFITFGRDVLIACRAYLKGARVGHAEEVKEGVDETSQHFKDKLVGFLSVFVPTLLQIGAKDCEEFISLAMRGN